MRTIIVETASRFARDLMVQEIGFKMLCDQGITLIAADSPESFLEDGPTSKLKGARDRKCRTEGKCQGRKSYAERDPELVALPARSRRAASRCMR